MEVQTENSKPPPVEPQSSGKINKAAFKLFGKRRSGSGMPSIFSVRNKGEGGSSGGNKAAGKALELVRSKTHDGITSDTTSTSPLSDTSEGGTLGNAGMASGDQPHHHHHTGRSSSSSSTMPTMSRGTLSKSISFFSLLRRNSVRGGDGGGGCGGSSGCSVGRRSRGLRGFFSSWRWRRKQRPRQQEQEEASEEVGREVTEGDVLTVSRSGSAELINKDVTLTLTSDPQAVATEKGSESPTVSTAIDAVASMHSGTLEGETQGTQGEAGRGSPPIPHTVFEERSPDISPLRASVGGRREDKLGSPARLASDSARDSSCMTPPLDRSLADPPSEPSVDRLCSMFNDVTSLKSFDSLTGCGDIIADVEDEPGNGNGNGNGTSGTSSGTASSGTTSSNGASISGRRASERGSPAKPALASQVTPITQTPVPVSTFLPAHQRVLATASMSSATGPPKKPSPQPPAQGSGVVAYMGGGEEMASPEGVDDADMQGLWHMLPQKGEDSPDLPRSEHSLHHTTPSSRAEKRTPSLKGLGLSKIPVGGSGRSGKQQTPTRPSPPPVDKDLQDAPPSDEGYWDSPTPVAEDEDGSFLCREVRLPRESCSGDALYDLYDPDSPSAVGSDEDDTSSQSASTGTVTLSPRSPSQPNAPSSFRSMKGSTSLPRDSKIPVSIQKVPPPHSSSQGELSKSATSPGSRPTSPTSPSSPTPREPAAKTNVAQPARTRIPVSKVPVRRTNNKKPATAGATRNRK
ncbi:hypothetical protein ACEWY4_019186 [Coilia grayii]|uniref:APC membrane recruitment protein 2 n=1 Tax=Coilia grayii TaxID=363190 RepID=A0ABD1JIA4_9TELE